MATVDQARFYETHGLETTELANALADWFRLQEFEWRTYSDPSGRYVLQIRKQSTGRTILGLNYALTVSFKSQDDGRTLIELGGADWTDKIVSGAIGLFFLTPLLFTAAYGAWQQGELNNRVWEFLNGYIFNRTGKPANSVTAVPYYTGVPGYNPNVPPPPGAYYPAASYAPTGMGGFPPVTTGEARPTGSQDGSWFDPATMQPIFDQQIGRMASWQQAMADGKIVDEEVKEQTEKVDRLRQQVEEKLSTEQRIKFAEVVSTMERLETLQKAAKA